MQAYKQSIEQGEVKSKIEDGLAALKAKYQSYKENQDAVTVNAKAAFDQIHTPELSDKNHSSDQSDSVSNSSKNSANNKINNSNSSPGTLSKGTRGLNANSQFGLGSSLLRTPPNDIEEAEISLNEKND